MRFQEDLARFADAIRNRTPHVKGEEATKHALVVPFLQVLGYDVFDPREVQPEYIADFAKRKPAGQLEKIDYAVWLNGQPAIFIECKAVDAKLENHAAQLARYFNATPSVKVAILTNGVRVKVFADLQQPNIMDPTPWLDVDLLALKPAEIDALRRFRKPDFAPEQITSLAEEMVYYSAMASLLGTQLREPSESFIRWVAGELPAVGRVTAKVVERLEPILRRSLQAAIVDHVARSFGPSTPEPGPASPPPAAAPAAEPRDEGARDGVITTPEELAAFEAISGWVKEARPGAVIAGRDAKSYFTFHQNNVRKWWLRMNIQHAPFWVSFRHVTSDDVRVLAPGVEIIEPQFGDSRVALASHEDLPKLRSVVIAAFDREAARKAEDAHKSDEPHAQ